MASYLTQISPDLQSLGESANLLYYETSDVKISSIEFSNRVGRYIRSLNSLQFGSHSDISIPNFDFLSSTYLQVELPPLKANITVPDGWLFHAIDNITYSWGTSNVSLVKISGQDLLHHNYLCCETREKREKMLFLGGTQKGITGGDETTSRKAQILLKFPWSVMCCDKKKSFDTRLLDTNMLIQITWKTKQHIFGWPLASAADVPESFTRAEVIVKQNELTNHSDSLYSDMKADPSLIYSYPFVHLQTGSNERFLSQIGETTVRYELQGFLNSDLIGIMFSISRITDTVRTSDPNFAHPNPFDLQHVSDILLEYNGQILSSYPGNLNELANLNISKGDTTCNQSKLVPSTGLVDPNTTLSYVWYLPFTQYKNLTFTDEYNNCPVYKSQPMDLQFTYTSDVAEQMVVRTTYMYNAYTAIQDMSSKMHFG
jgi:hypothetical protein